MQFREIGFLTIEIVVIVYFIYLAGKTISALKSDTTALKTTKILCAIGIIQYVLLLVLFLSGVLNIDIRDLCYLTVGIGAMFVAIPNMIARKFIANKKHEENQDSDNDA